MENLNIFFKSLIFKSLLLLTSTAFATNPPFEPENTYSICDLEAPSNIQVSEIGPSWMTLTWNPVENASGYQINAIDVVSGSVISSLVLSTPQTSCTIQGLQPGHTYRYAIAARCSINGSWSTSDKVAFKGDYISLIIELLDVGLADIDPSNTFIPCDHPIHVGSPAICFSSVDSVPICLGEIYRADKWGRFQSKIVGFP